MRVVRDLDEDLWRGFVDRHPHGNVFHTPEMFAVFDRAEGHDPELWAVLDGACDVLALMTPVHVTLSRGLMQRLTTRSIAYGSVLCRDDPRGRDALRLLLTNYAEETRHRSLFTELRNLHDLGDLRGSLEGCGYVYEDHLDYLLDLDRPAEVILEGIGRKTRKAIRKGLRDGHVHVTEVADRSELADLYELLRQTYGNARVPLADRSLFEAASDVLGPRGMVKLFLARVQGAPAACSVELRYKDVIYGWYGGTDRAYGRYIPNEMLTWHVLEWGAGSDARTYDFGGAGRPGEAYGVRDFKAKFGGELVSFGRYVRVHSPNRLRLSRLGYRLYQRIDAVRRIDRPARRKAPAEEVMSGER